MNTEIELLRPILLVRITHIGPPFIAPCSVGETTLYENDSYNENLISHYKGHDSFTMLRTLARLFANGTFTHETRFWDPDHFNKDESMTFIETFNCYIEAWNIEKDSCNCHVHGGVSPYLGEN